eukprot:TRINITY_DN408_c0_g1_i9.p1 TRINITY_DN408_c0_g1~~TRINITY_DN408_c0_g1_i9.p1  ORF type:complete len:503 (+),score=108.84 TRINITY_DN408_c0_g1_i9:65-1573(+)
MFLESLRRDWEDIVKDEEKLLPLEHFWDGKAGAEAGVTDHDVALRFISFAMERDLYYDFAVAFVQKEVKKNGGSIQLFREESTLVTLLSTHWFKKDGMQYLSELILPMIRDIPDECLETSPSRAEKGANVKRNLKVLLQLEEKLIQGILNSGDLFPVAFRTIMQRIDGELSKKYEMGTTIVAGLLFLRLINPAIIFPDNYGLVSASEITSNQRRSLVLIAKILQSMATGTVSDDPSVAPARSYVRSKQPSWNHFFSRLITGSDMAHDDHEAFHLTVDELIAYSNMDLPPQDMIESQRDLLSAVFLLEKEMTQWKMYRNDMGSFRYSIQKLPSGQVAFNTALRFDIPMSVADSHHWRLENENLLYPEIVSVKYLDEISPQLVIKQSVHDAHWPTAQRELVCLRFHELMPDDQFAIVAMKSVARDDVPVTKGCVRASVEVGWIARPIADKKDMCRLTMVQCIDMGGKTHLLPKSLASKNLKKHVAKRMKTMRKLFGDQLIMEIE